MTSVAGETGNQWCRMLFSAAAANSAFYRRRGQATLNCSALLKWIGIGARIRDNDARW